MFFTKAFFVVVVCTLVASCTATRFKTGDQVRSQGGYARAAGVSTSSAPEDSLVAVSYNIRFGERIDEAIADLRRDPHLAVADVLFLQEMSPGGCERVARVLGYDFVYYPAAIHPHHGRLFGNAILARGRIVEPRLVVLPKRGIFSGTTRIAVGADLAFGPEHLDVACTHLSTPRLSREQRVRQVQTMVDRLASGSAPMLIGGDFNTTTVEDTARFGEVMRIRGFRHVAFPGNSTTRGSDDRPGRLRLLDHFYYRGLEPRRSGVGTQAVASDHFPIWAVFAWPPGILAPQR